MLRKSTSLASNGRSSRPHAILLLIPETVLAYANSSRFRSYYSARVGGLRVKPVRAIDYARFIEVSRIRINLLFEEAFGWVVHTLGVRSRRALI